MKKMSFVAQFMFEFTNKLYGNFEKQLSCKEGFYGRVELCISSQKHNTMDVHEKMDPPEGERLHHNNQN